MCHYHGANASLLVARPLTQLDKGIQHSVSSSICVVKFRHFVFVWCVCMFRSRTWRAFSFASPWWPLFAFAFGVRCECARSAVRSGVYAEGAGSAVRWKTCAPCLNNGGSKHLSAAKAPAQASRSSIWPEPSWRLRRSAPNAKTLQRLPRCPQQAHPRCRLPLDGKQNTESVAHASKGRALWFAVAFALAALNWEARPWCDGTQTPQGAGGRCTHRRRRLTERDRRMCARNFTATKSPDAVACPSWGLTCSRGWRGRGCSCPCVGSHPRTGWLLRFDGGAARSGRTRCPMRSAKHLSSTFRRTTVGKGSTDVLEVARGRLCRGRRHSPNIAHAQKNKNDEQWRKRQVVYLQRSWYRRNTPKVCFFSAESKLRLCGRTVVRTNDPSTRLFEGRRRRRHLSFLAFWTTTLGWASLSWNPTRNNHTWQHGRRSTETSALRSSFSSSHASNQEVTRGR